MKYTYQVNSPLGKLTLASCGESLTGLWIEEQKYFAAGVKSPVKDERLPIFNTVEAWLVQYFDGKNPEINFPVSPEGTAFRKEVWDILRKIPYGKVITYGDIANQINNPSARAVGGAVGHNPVSIIIPCHRVVGSNGSLTGFAGGLDAKTTLLKLENAVIF